MGARASISKFSRWHHCTLSKLHLPLPQKERREFQQAADGTLRGEEQQEKLLLLAQDYRER